MKKQNNVSCDDLLMHCVDYVEDNDDVKSFLEPKAADRVLSFVTVLRAARGVIHSSGKHFSTEKRHDLHQDKRIKCTKVGIDVLHAVQQYRDPSFLELMQRIDPSPEINLFNECVAQSGILGSQQGLQERRNPGTQALVALYNDLINKIREGARTPEFKAAVNANKRRCNKNRQGIEKLIDSIFKRHSRVVVIRLDCHYKRPDGMQDDEFARHITVEQARNDLKAFRKKIARQGLCEHLIAYVVKMEMGPRKGIHFHVMMFFDGRHHREDITIATKLGEYWKEVTEGRGTFFNCNQKWVGKPHCAVGTIHRDDKEMLSALKERVVTYLTKVDEYFQFLPLISGRTLFRSIVKKPRRPEVLASEVNQYKKAA